VDCRHVCYSGSAQRDPGNTGATLINLQQQEAQLIMKNSELKIEVEKLKEPERITQIAEKQLGMSVARSNIYVKAKN
jgi:cell division protein FtsL